MNKDMVIVTIQGVKQALTKDEAKKLKQDLSSELTPSTESINVDDAKQVYYD